MIRQWLVEFADDTKVHILLLLLVADFALGVGASLKPPVTFRLSYVADLLKRDLLGKVIPYFAVYVLALVQGNEDLVIPGLDFGLIAGAAYALAVGAMAGSILNSAAKLGLSLPTVVAGDEQPETTGDAPAVITEPPTVNP
jgi:hypothetical protein